MNTIDISTLTHPDTFALVDSEDYFAVAKHKWHVNPCGGSGLYAHRRKDGKLVSMHREILGAKDGEYVDHINGDSLDNRRRNLRICTNAENGRNSKISKANKSGYKGVGWNSQRKLWRAKITVNRKSIELGFHVCPLRASSLYDDAAKKHFGEFARLNDAKMNCTDLGKALECFRGLDFYWARDIEMFPCFDEQFSYTRNEIIAKTWLLGEATPAQIWEICCLAKEGE